jgi:hypothetical protein
MDDDRNQLPKDARRVTVLSPILQSNRGNETAHNPAFAGTLPADNIGLVGGGNSMGREVPDAEFRKFPETRRKK